MTLALIWQRKTSFDPIGPATRLTSAIGALEFKCGAQVEELRLHRDGSSFYGQLMITFA